MGEGPQSPEGSCRAHLRAGGGSHLCRAAAQVQPSAWRRVHGPAPPWTEAASSKPRGGGHQHPPPRDQPLHSSTHSRLRTVCGYLRQLIQGWDGSARTQVGLGIQEDRRILCSSFISLQRCGCCSTLHLHSCRCGSPCTHSTRGSSRSGIPCARTCGAGKALCPPSLHLPPAGRRTPAASPHWHPGESQKTLGFARPQRRQ